VSLSTFSCERNNGTLLVQIDQKNRFESKKGKNGYQPSGYLPPSPTSLSEFVLTLLIFKSPIMCLPDSYRKGTGSSSIVTVCALLCFIKLRLGNRYDLGVSSRASQGASTHDVTPCHSLSSFSALQSPHNHQELPAAKASIELLSAEVRSTCSQIHRNFLLIWARSPECSCENMTTTFLSEIERTSNPMYYVVLSKIDPSYVAGCHNGLWSLHKTILSFQHFLATMTAYHVLKFVHVRTGLTAHILHVTGRLIL